MGTGRLEAFSDGVIAIIITIMVLELKVPLRADPATLLAQWPVFLSYALSYLVVAIYWVNHHRLFHIVPRVNSAVLWSNNFLLFCLSLIPFATAYMGENQFRPFPTATYAALLLACAIAFLMLREIVSKELTEVGGFDVLRGRRGARTCSASASTRCRCRRPISTPRSPWCSRSRSPRSTSCRKLLWGMRSGAEGRRNSS